MYTPPKFRVQDQAEIRSFVEDHSFGLLLTAEGEELIHDTHTPFVYSDDGQHLLGHIARANPQWRHWKDGTVAKVIFTGPHTYISPRFYESEFAVPTWNYTAVSISGRISVITDEEEVLRFLDQLTAGNETSEEPWKLDRSDERYLNLLSGIVAFSVSLDSVEASFKLNQNKTEEDQRKVVDLLSAAGGPFDHDVAELMAQNLTGKDSDKCEG